MGPTADVAERPGIRRLTHAPSLILSQHAGEACFQRCQANRRYSYCSQLENCRPVDDRKAFLPSGAPQPFIQTYDFQAGRPAFADDEGSSKL